MSDGDEDTNHNGQIDEGEGDPNDPADDVAEPECTTDADCGSETSGTVCDDETKVCIEGCRGNGGNTCPSGEVCSSVDETIGTCGPDGTGGGGGGASEDDTLVVQGGGCSCSVPSDGHDGSAPWALFAAGAAVAALRRRRDTRG